MAVKIGSARIDERGRTTGGQAGDQKAEVSTQNWYKHSKGWHVFRAKSAQLRELMAQAMEWACANKDIGYDQNQRTTLYNNVAAYGYDPRKTTKPVETDCSALVRVCICFATSAMGKLVDPGNFRTATQSKALMATGLFEKLTDAAHCDSSTKLARGDILCTKTSGHTVIVLSNGSKCDAGDDGSEAKASGELRRGDRGEKVRQLQYDLILLGYDCGPSGADGDFGENTELAVKALQVTQGLDVDGIAGAETLAMISKIKTATVLPMIEITGESVNIRSAPNKTTGTVLGVARRGDTYTYQGQKDGDWYLIVYKSYNAWVSGKYSKEVHV